VDFITVAVMQQEAILQMDKIERLQRIADNAPSELKAIPRWVGYQLVPKEDGKFDKVPYDPNTGNNASSTNPATWASFDQAIQFARTNAKIHGVSIALTDDDNLVGIDFDGAVVDGNVVPLVMDAVTLLDTYAEISPSDTGLRIFCYGELPPKGRKKGAAEMYQTGRFMTVTGNHLSNTPGTVNERCAELTALHRQIFGEDKPNTNPSTQQPVSPALLAIDDQALLDKMFTYKNGAAVRSLWDGHHDGDQSAADMALCGHLAFYTGRDAARMDRLFRQSGLMRDKWDRNARTGETYGEGTISRAIASCTEVYTPAEDIMDRIIHNATTPAPSTNGTGPHRTSANIEPIHCTDLGNARRMVRQFGADLHYVYAWGKWFIWDGSRWAEDETGEIERVAKRTVTSIYAEAAETENTDERKNLAKWALASEGQSKISAMIALARSEVGISVKHADLDGDPMLLNCQNGTIDLRTGQLLPHNRKFLTTKKIDIAYDKAATCPLWHGFLNRIMDNNPALIAFLQRAVGYSLTASVVEQCLFFLHGNGSNGKSTFTETIQALFGDYGQKAPTEMIMLKQNTGAIPNDVARLPGARFVVTAEIEGGRRLAESLVKDLTGGDKMVARFMRQEYFEFTPTHKLWIYGNHKPVIKGSDNGIWRRINMIPFTVQIPDAEKDEQLKDKLRAELPGILAWAVQGCLDWQRDGLKPPAEVKAATAAYRAESDALSAFIKECCTENINHKVRFDSLYSAYKSWCERNNERAESGRQFGNSLTERGFEASKGMGNKAIRLGIDLVDTKPAEDESAEDETMPTGRISMMI
jgi:putative DNA primase/helicase